MCSEVYCGHATKSCSRGGSQGRAQRNRGRCGRGAGKLEYPSVFGDLNLSKVKVVKVDNVQSRVPQDSTAAHGALRLGHRCPIAACLIYNLSVDAAGMRRLTSRTQVPQTRDHCLSQPQLHPLGQHCKYLQTSLSQHQYSPRSSKCINKLWQALVCLGKPPNLSLSALGVSLTTTESPGSRILSIIHFTTIIHVSTGYHISVSHTLEFNTEFGLHTYSRR